MSIMNVGACILGYADKFVDKEVKKVINKGDLHLLTPLKNLS